MLTIAYSIDIIYLSMPIVGIFTDGLVYDDVQNFSFLDINCANPGNPVFTCDKRTVDKAKHCTFDPKGDLAS